MRVFATIAAVVLALTLHGGAAAAAEAQAQTQSVPAGRQIRPATPAQPAQTGKAAPAAGSIQARLLNQGVKARQKAATVEVTVRGVKLVDPDKTLGTPVTGQGHLHYVLDAEAVIATISPKLSFHGLSAGRHTITVMLAANDHTPLGPSETLSFTIP